jgi:acetolactate synthase-1/2/3 large subunit
MIQTKIDVSGPTGSEYRQRFEQVQNSHNEMMGQLTEQAMADKNKKPLSSRWFFHTLGKTLPGEAIIVDETISHSRLLRKYLAEPNSYVRGSCGGLGMGLGETAGAKLASGNRPVVFIVGDGTFNYNPVPGGLGVLQEYNLPVLIIILNNAGYIAMSQGYHKHFPEGWAASHKKYLGVNIEPSPDYVKLAEAFGAYGEKIEEPEDIEPALNRALEELAQGRSALLDVIVETS